LFWGQVVDCDDHLPHGADGQHAEEEELDKSVVGKSMVRVEALAHGDQKAGVDDRHHGSDTFGCAPLVPRLVGIVGVPPIPPPV